MSYSKIPMNDMEPAKKPAARDVNFEFLNSFRGILAVIVVIDHIYLFIPNKRQDGIFKEISNLVDYFALPGNDFPSLIIF